MRRNPWHLFLSRPKNSLRLPQAKAAYMYVLAEFDANLYDKKKMLEAISKQYSLVRSSVSDKEVLQAFRKVCQNPHFSCISELDVFRDCLSDGKHIHQVERKVFLTLLNNDKSQGFIEKISWSLDQTNKDEVVGEFLKQCPIYKDFDFYKNCIDLCKTHKQEHFIPFYTVMYEYTHYGKNQCLNNSYQKSFEERNTSELYYGCQREAALIVSRFAQKNHYSLARAVALMFLADDKDLTRELELADKKQKSFRREIRFGG